MDKDTAYWLQSHFNGSSVVTLEGLTEPPTLKRGRPKIHANDSERVKAWRKRKREREGTLIREVRALNGWDKPKDQKPNLKNLAIFGSKYDTTAAATLAYTNIDSVMQQLKECHNQTIAAKEANALTSSAIFNPAIDDIETKRGKNNIAYVSGIWLDNDGGDLSYQQFSNIFPELRMAIMNTYSSTKEMPRWRCYIPISHTIGIETHDMIIQNMMQRLADYGYYGIKICDQYPNKRFHGFDEGKFQPQSLFYLPSQAADPTNSFFYDLKTDRTVLDVEEWIYGDSRLIELEQDPADAITVKIIVPSTITNTTNPKHPQIDQAIKDWRNTGVGDGFNAFAKLFGKLKRLGMSKYELEQILIQESQYGHSPKDRREEVKSLMKYYNR